MQQWEYYAQYPLVLLAVIGKYALPIMLVLTLIGAIGLGALIAVLAKRPAPRRMGVAQFLALPPSTLPVDYEVTGRLRVRRDGGAWLEASGAAVAGGDPGPRVRIHPDALEIILAALPVPPEGDAEMEAFAWFRGKLLIAGGESTLAGITKGAVLHQEGEYRIERAR